MRVGIVGLGKMGSQIVGKLITGGHEVVVTDVNHHAVENCARHGAIPALNREEFVGKLGSQPVVWLMVPADAVEAEVNAYRQLLPQGSILVDGGNSNFQASIARAGLCEENGITFMDVGTSGGVLGFANGFSLMVGGERGAFEAIEPILETLTKPYGAYAYMGPSGYGHYVKMVHNGIEYGLMQAYAEGYDVLKYGPLENIDLARVAHVWQHGSIVASTLNALIEKILTENADLEGIEGYVADSGEGRWTLETAESAGIDMPALRSALEIRKRSQEGYHVFPTKLLAAMRNAFGGHPLNKK